MEWVTTALNVVVLVVLYLKTREIKAYADQKGKNLATKQDIGEITRQIEAVRHEYSVQLELFKKQAAVDIEEAKFSIRLRERALTMAELGAEWLSEGADRKKLTQLCFESSFWLPADLIREFTRTLNGQEGARSIFELMIEVRKLMGMKDDLIPQDMTYFPKEQPKDGTQPLRTENSKAAG
jgi:hypothetical protein